MQDMPDRWSVSGRERRRRDGADTLCTRQGAAGAYGPDDVPAGTRFRGFCAAIGLRAAGLQGGAGAIIFFAVILGAGLAFGSLFWSDKIALSAAGAQEVTPAQAPQLHGIIDRICALADMPKPRVAIAQSDMPNAFATGRNSKNAVVCVTTGLLRRL